MKRTLITLAATVLMSSGLVFAQFHPMSERVAGRSGRADDNMYQRQYERHGLRNDYRFDRGDDYRSRREDDDYRYARDRDRRSDLRAPYARSRYDAR